MRRRRRKKIENVEKEKRIIVDKAKRRQEK